MNINDKLLFLFPDANLSLNNPDWVIGDNGDGIQYIEQWNRGEPQPTQSELDAVSIADARRNPRKDEIENEGEQLIRDEFARVGALRMRYLKRLAKGTLPAQQEQYLDDLDVWEEAVEALIQTKHAEIDAAVDPDAVTVVWPTAP